MVITVIMVIAIDEERLLHVYDLNGNILLQNVFDKIRNGNELVARKIGKVSMYFQDEKIIKTVVDMDFNIIKKKRYRHKGNTNPFIGSFDLETFTNVDGISEVYALGFATLKSKAENKKYLYLTSYQSSFELILACIDDMLAGYDNHIFYTHNLGGFDVIFLLKVLEANEVKGHEYYILDTIFRTNRILKFTVRIKHGTKYKTRWIIFIDSYNIVTDSLDKLSVSFGSSVKKG